MCIGVGSFLLLGPGGESQINKIVEKKISHQCALVQVYFSYLDQARRANQIEFQKRKYHTNVHWYRVISPAWTRRRKTNLKSSARKGLYLLHTTDPLSLRHECMCLKLNDT